MGAEKAVPGEGEAGPRPQNSAMKMLRVTVKQTHQMNVPFHKEFACNVRDLGLIPGLGRSLGGGHGNPFQYSSLENPHGQRHLGYSP